MGYSPWGLKEWDTTTKRLSHTHTHTHTYTSSSQARLEIPVVHIVESSGVGWGGVL